MPILANVSHTSPHRRCREVCQTDYYCMPADLWVYAIAVRFAKKKSQYHEYRRRKYTDPRPGVYHQRHRSIVARAQGKEIKDAVVHHRRAASKVEVRVRVYKAWNAD